MFDFPSGVSPLLLLKSVVLKLILKTIAIIWEFISMKYMSLDRNCYSSRFTFIAVNWSNSELDMMVFDILSTVFSLKYEVSPSQWLKKIGNTFICIFRVAYMNSKQTWLLAKVYCQFEAKFRTLMIEEILSAAKFRFEAKIQRKSALCSNEMSLKRPRTFDRIFARTFDERSLEQVTKFAEFRLHYFCTILK